MIPAAAIYTTAALQNPLHAIAGDSEMVIDTQELNVRHNKKPPCGQRPHCRCPANLSYSDRSQALAVRQYHEVLHPHFAEKPDRIGRASPHTRSNFGEQRKS
jgi:hypothetical protein